MARGGMQSVGIGGWRRTAPVFAAALMVAVCYLAIAAAAHAQDRHIGYYYPVPTSTETYTARALTLPDASRESRLGFVVGMTRQMMGQAYPPQFAIFAKGDHAEKMIIVSLNDGYLNTLYRARAVLAMLTSVARATRFLTELGVADFFTFFDLAKLLGFKKITISDGDTFAHQVFIK